MIRELLGVVGSRNPADPDTALIENTTPDLISTTRTPKPDAFCSSNTPRSGACSVAELLEFLVKKARRP
jgi:hypothetical protein